MLKNSSLATFIAKEAERQQARADAKDVKIKKGLEGRPRPKARFDDTKYLDDHEAALESVGDAVLQALLTKKSPVVSSSTAPSKDAQDPKGKGKRKLDSVDAPVTKPNVKNIKATSAATSSTAYAWADNLSDAIVESSSEEE